MSARAEADFRARAAARAGRVGKKSTLLEVGDDADLSASTTAEERLGMMWELATAAWAVSGRAIPDYARSEMPGRIIRPDEPCSPKQAERKQRG